MPPKKAKDENNPQSNKISNTSSFAPETKTPDEQVQNTKYEGIMLLSPVVQQLDKDIDCAINDNISSSNKKFMAQLITYAWENWWNQTRMSTTKKKT